MTDLWLEASRDYEADDAEVKLNKAKMVTASLWPFFALASSENDFYHRLALAMDQIEGKIPDGAIREQVIASFREDFDFYRQAAADDDQDEEPDGDEDDAKPWEKDASLQMFHEASGEWITVQAAAEPTPGNPEFPTFVPEQGPITNQTGDYPKHPTGADPVDPINQMFPMQPSEWKEIPELWVDRPMNFAPYQNPGNYGKVSAATMPTHPDHPGHYTNEGVETGLGPNPFYFAGGEEGVAGNQQAGFPADVSAPESRGADQVDWYGSVPPLPSSGSTGDGHPYSNPGVNKQSAFFPPQRLSGPRDAEILRAKRDIGFRLTQHEHDFLQQHKREEEERQAQQPQEADPGTERDLGPRENLPSGPFDWPSRPFENLHTPNPRESAKDNHGACYDCNQPVYRHGDEWHHLGQPPQNGHSVRLPSDHPWVQARMGARKEAEYKYIHQDGDEWVITQKGTGKVLSRHDSEEKAKASFRAMMQSKHSSLKVADVSSSDMGPDTGDAGAPQAPPSMTPGGPGAEAMPPMNQAMTIPNSSVRQNPFPNEPAGGGGGANPFTSGNPFMGSIHTANPMTRDRPDMFNPTGVGDEFTERTWEGQTTQSPRQPMEQRNVNTPQRPMEPIRQTTSDGGPRDEEEDED